MDLEPFLSRLSIVDTRAHLIPFQLNWAQQQYLQEVHRQYDERKLVRIITLKARQLGVCLDPSTRVLTADLQWMRLEDIEVGTEIIAVDEAKTKSRGVGRKMRTGVVEAKREVLKRGYRLTLDSGVVLTATGNHRFLSHVRGGTDTLWREVYNFQVGDEIRYITEPWVAEESFEDGWFGGFVDGEGSLRPKSRAGVELSVCQVEGDALTRAIDYLESRGYTYRTEVDKREAGASSKLGNKPVHKLVCTRMNELFRLMGCIRPTRFVSQRWWEGKDLPGKKSGKAWAKVVAIESVATQRFIDLQTSTQTFIAEGVVSHNSTVTEGVMFTWCFLFPRTQGLVIAHETDSSQHLLGMTQTYWDTYPFNRLFTPKYKSRKELSWVETASSLKVATAKTVDTGRSKTLHCLHASEIAFWDHAHITMGGLEQAFHYEPDTFGCLESTANGVGGFFYDHWQAATSGDIEYVPLFFPWYKHPQYQWSYINRIQGKSLPPTGHLDEEERAMTQGLKVDSDHIQWRRWAIKNLCQSSTELFHQEYPSTPEEAFVATGTNVFPIEHLAKCYEPIEHPVVGRLVRDGASVRLVPDIAGPFRIFAYPSSDTSYGQYIVAGDPTRVTMGDPAAAQVLNRRTYEQVAIWRGRVDPATFGEELAKIGKYYNDALITTEVTGPGAMTIGALIQMQYPNLWRHRWYDRDPNKVSTAYGWDTNEQRKQWAIGWALKLIVDHVLTIHDPRTMMECKNYVTLPNGGYGPNTRDGNDDCVMSLAIACVCNSTEVLGAYEGPVAAMEPDRDYWQAWNEEPA